MVAIIRTNSSIRKTLYYNEQKVREGKALMIAAIGYFKPAEALSQSAKLNRLLNLATLNQISKINSVHISINFHPNDNLTTQQLKEIASTYMEQIGLGMQPFLVYQHFDAAHPHMHIVTTKITHMGTCIDMYIAGTRKSPKAQEYLEDTYGLVKARHSRSMRQTCPAKVIRYGKNGIKQSIETVLSQVLDTYNYTSLSELNAILKAYNVRAENGKPGSKLLQYQGLIYLTLDDKGRRVGVPLKASLLSGKPGILFLTRKFIQNHKERLRKTWPLQQAIDLYFFNNKHCSIDALHDHLKKKGIDFVCYSNTQGMIEEFGYVDHIGKISIDGNNLGIQYGATMLMEKSNVRHTIDLVRRDARKNNILKHIAGTTTKRI